MPARFCTCQGCPACGPGSCGAIFDMDDPRSPGLRCPACQATATRRKNTDRPGRPTAAQRGYGPEYRRNREIVVSLAIAAANAGQPVLCWLCKRPCLATQKLSAEHKKAVRDGGSSALPNLACAHLACNTAWNRGR